MWRFDIRRGLLCALLLSCSSELYAIRAPLEDLPRPGQPLEGNLFPIEAPARRTIPEANRDAEPIRRLPIQYDALPSDEDPAQDERPATPSAALDASAV